MLFKSMKNRKVFIGAILISLIILIIFAFDFGIVEGINLIRNGFLNDFFLGLTFISSEIIIFFFLTSLFLWRDKKRRYILPLWLTLVLTAIVSFLLKIAIQRPRPFQLGLVSVLPVLEKASHIVWNFSFPSFHTMLAFSAIPFLSEEFPKLKYFWIIFASLIAFSRVYFGLHFLSDVIVGGLIGYLLGAVIIRIEKENKFWEKIYMKFFEKK